LSPKTLKSDGRYSFYVTFVDYGGVKQKWVLLLSHKMKEKKEKTLKNKFDKEIEKARKSSKKLKRQDFFCDEDALKAVETWIQDFLSVVFQYFTNWIGKSSRFIPNSKYFSVKWLKS
jgi:transposase